MAESDKPSASGHYSWNAATAARREELARLGVSTAPQKVDEGGGHGGAGGATSPHASAWNSAGTWEERVVTAPAHAALKARLLAAAFPASPRLKFTGVPMLNGEVRLVCVRGKVRCGYELRLEAAWELAAEGGGGGGGGAAASGSILATLEDTDPDVFDKLEVRVATHAAMPKGEAVALVKLADATLRDVVRAWQKATIAG